MSEIGLAAGLALGFALVIEISKRIRHRDPEAPTKRKRRTVWMFTRKDDIE
jgi:hypothetical protein